MSFDLIDSDKLEYIWIDMEPKDDFTYFHYLLNIYFAMLKNRIWDKSIFRKAKSFASISFTLFKFIKPN